MNISVIIPTCNRNDLLSKCLGQLAPSSQVLKAENYEVIVTDDSKDNNARSLVEANYPWAKWVEGPKRGPASNRNNGATLASGKWIAFIDDDCLPDKNLLAEYQKAILTNPEAEVFEGCIKANREKRSFVEESPVNEKGGYLWSCNFIIKKSLFEEMAGFDEGFPFAAVEDVEFHYRLQKSRKRIVFVEPAVVIHPWRVQKKVFSATSKRFKSLLFFLNKHPEKANSLDSKFYFRISFRGLKSLVTESFKYRFRGVGGRLIFCFLHFYFGLYLLMRPLWVRKNAVPA